MWGINVLCLQLDVAASWLDKGALVVFFDVPAAGPIEVSPHLSTHPYGPADCNQSLLVTANAFFTSLGLPDPCSCLQAVLESLSALPRSRVGAYLDLSQSKWWWWWW